MFSKHDALKLNEQLQGKFVECVEWRDGTLNIVTEPDRNRRTALRMNDITRVVERAEQKNAIVQSTPGCMGAVSGRYKSGVSNTEPAPPQKRYAYLPLSFVKCNFPPCGMGRTDVYGLCDICQTVSVRLKLIED